SHMAFNQAATLSLGIGPCDGADGDAQTVGEVTMGRQPIAGLQLAVAYICRERISDCLVAWAIDGREVRDPNCHGDKFPIDSLLCHSCSCIRRYNSPDWPETWQLHTSAAWGVGRGRSR